MSIYSVLFGFSPVWVKITIFECFQFVQIHITWLKQFKTASNWFKITGSSIGNCSSDNQNYLTSFFLTNVSLPISFDSTLSLLTNHDWKRCLEDFRRNTSGRIIRTEVLSWNFVGAPFEELVEFSNFQKNFMSTWHRK